MNHTNIVMSAGAKEVGEAVPPGRLRLAVHGAYWLGLLSLAHIGFGRPHDLNDIPLWPAALVVALLCGAVGGAFAILKRRHPRASDWFALHLQWHVASWSVLMYVMCTALAIRALGHVIGNASPATAAVLLRSPYYIAAIVGVWFAYRMVCGYGAYLTRTSPERCMLGTRSDFEQLLQQRR